MKRLLMLLLTATLAVACGKDDGPEVPRTAEQTLLMYFPWSGNLTDAFANNIQDMKEAIGPGIPSGCRILVFFMENTASGRLFELVHKGGEVQEKELAAYKDPAVTTAEGIAAILGDAVRLAPARRYGMTIGSHGMAWIPADAGRGAEDGRRYGLRPEREYWEQTDGAGHPLTRWFGGTADAWKTEIATLRTAIEAAGIHLEFILFDDCYMASVEVAYELRRVADHLIASTCEVMYHGFPYDRMGSHLLGAVDYEAVCDEFHDFYSSYEFPYGTISVTNCNELEALAAVMKRINDVSDAGAVDPAELQALDGYTPTRFFDLGDYVRHLCSDEALYSTFAEQLERCVPASCRRHTPCYFSGTGSRIYPIRTYSGITVSDPSDSPMTATKEQTAWWQATH